MIVVDTNILVSLFGPSHRTQLVDRLDVPLVTVDRQILAQFPGRAVSLDGFASA